MTIAIVLIVAFALIISVLAVILNKKSKALNKAKSDYSSLETDYNEMFERYKGIINVETELHNRTNELNELVSNLEKIGNEFALENARLNRDFQSKRSVYESLLKQVSLLEENYLKKTINLVQKLSRNQNCPLRNLDELKKNNC